MPVTLNSEESELPLLLSASPFFADDLDGLTANENCK
eukprot:COSAG06_NODE_60_length_27159_cov_57.986031_25_plen_37_part_00